MKHIKLRIEVTNKTINPIGEKIKYEDLKKSNANLESGFEKVVTPCVIKQNVIKKVSRLGKTEIYKEKEKINKNGIINNSIKDIE